ncbi:MAG: 3',5'-cyclic-AMP phosphodiesterase [Kaiparowitsia implicata GSE-PSE-MK54-09C]|jgi:Icc protein|nr:3',5'-cyclic-AMP phosphodiesterase [Kaiparowitsia implicata GSE-PSE-MK54-09C]
MLVAQITDTHLFAEGDRQLKGIATADALAAVLRAVDRLMPRPDVLLLTGDLSQDETAASYDRLRSLVAPLGIPTYWIPGNHDIPVVMEPILQGEPFFSAKQLQHQEWTLLLLNSAVVGQTAGVLSDRSLTWLDQHLQQGRDRPTLIALHHPPFAIGSAWMDSIGLQQPEQLFAVLDRHPQVKVVLFGHIHQAVEAERQGVLYLGTPSTCVQFMPNSSEFAIDSQRSPGFRLLHLHPDGRVETQVQRVPILQTATAE